MIYVIHCDGYCKIGTTRGDPQSRLRDLSTGNPHELTLMVTIPGGGPIDLDDSSDFTPIDLA